ncbi:MAG TPA: transporter substrate-binding domain-containing protein [Chitinimonas sp.]
MTLIATRAMPRFSNLALLGLLIPTCQAAGPDLILYTEDLPPFNFQLPDGQISGSVTEKIALISKQASFQYQVVMMPWARALSTARSQANACVYSTARTTEREAWFSWIGPMAHNEGILFSVAERPPVASSLQGAMTARIGGYNGSASAIYLSRRGYNVIMSANHDISIKNLLAGRLDYWLTNRHTANAMSERLGLRGRLVPAIPVVNMELYLACNPALDGQLLKRIRQAYLLLQQNGSLAAVDRKYGE